MHDLTETEIMRRLARLPKRKDNQGCSAEWLAAASLQVTPRPASVLIPFLRITNEWHILLTRRTESVADHKGQVAFPGGSADPEDVSPIATALREAEEEIGLRAQDVRVLGCLQELPTNTRYCITPIIGIIPWPYPINLAEVEVSRAFTIPLRWLADPSHRETRTRMVPGFADPQPVIYFQRYDGEVLWGVSAQITVDLLSGLEL